MMTRSAPSRWRIFKAAILKTFRAASKPGMALGLAFFCVEMQAAEIDPAVRQIVVSIAPTWDSMTGRLQCFEREGEGWKPVTEAWPVIYGKNGLAWGRGVPGMEVGSQNPRTKVERDGRAPAGLFNIGTIYTYDAALPAGASYPFHTVGAGDAWIDDVSSPNYNRHLVIPDPASPPPWFEKAKMRHGDAAYRWLVEIRHNSDPPLAGAGSAIFFHIRRGPQRPSAGCTVMAEENLVRLIKFLRKDKAPQYVLLPRGEYEAKWKAWGLPSPAQAATLLP